MRGAYTDVPALYLLVYLRRRQPYLQGSVGPVAEEVGRPVDTCLTGCDGGKAYTASRLRRRVLIIEFYLRGVWTRHGGGVLVHAVGCCWGCSGVAAGLVLSAIGAPVDCFYP